MGLEQYLMPDLMPEVLVWLPVETLIKFRCVSKSWRALIDSTQFKQLHLRRILSWTSPEEQNKFLFRWSGCCWDGPYPKAQERAFVAEIDSRDLMPNKPMLELHLPRPFKKPVKNLRPRIRGSCNGLLFLQYYDCSNPLLILWNPYINKYWELPSYPLPGSGSGSVSTVPCYGFGYDDIANDFKVVRRFEFYNNNNNDLDEEKPDTLVGHEVIIYSMKSNSWTSLPQFSSFHPNHIARGNGIHVNCALHWVQQDTLYRDNAILALDLRTHKCNRIALPPDVAGQKNTRLETFDGCLCVIPKHKFGEPCLDVRIMKNYGVKDSWTKLIIQLPSLESKLIRTLPHRVSYSLLRPLSYSERGTKLFFYTPHRVMWYNIAGRDWDWATLVGSPRSVSMRGFQLIGSLIDPSPVTSVENTGNGASTQNAGIKRVEENLFC